MRYGNVKVIGVSENPITMTGAAARISHMSGTAYDVLKSVERMDVEDVVKMIKRVPHPSILEHCYINMMFTDVSMFVEQYMIETRLAAFTVKSRRYVNFGDAGFNVPDFSYIEDEDKQALAYLTYNTAMNCFNEYNSFVSKGVPVEDARYVLPYSFKSNFFVSMDARNYVDLIVDMVAGEGSIYPEIKFYGEQLKDYFTLELGFVDIDRIIERTQPRGNLNFDLSNGKRSNDLPLVELKDISHNIKDTILTEFLHASGSQLDSESEARLIANLSDEEFDNIMRVILKSKRQRELEQIHMRFTINDISLANYTHLTRHRMQSLNTPNLLNVVDFDKYIIPDSLIPYKDTYTSIYRNTKYCWEKLKEYGVRDEDRVYLFICGCSIPVTTSMNAAEFLHMAQLRCCNRAQSEIRRIVNEMLLILKKRDPQVFRYFGPSCSVSGVCPEGRMSCNQVGHMQEVYYFTDDTYRLENYLKTAK